jgi:CHAT domain-containing protein/Tfp pilus assembly protein PilF
MPCFRRVLVVVGGSLAVCAALTAADDDGSQDRVAPGVPMTRSIGAGDRLVFEVAIDAGDFLAAHLEGSEDLRVEVLAADGAPLPRAAIYSSLPNLQRVLAIGSTAGRYAVVVTANAGRVASPCTIVIDEVRPAELDDDVRLAAAGAQSAAERHRLEGTAASLKASLDEYGHARDLAHRIGDRRAEALALTGLGRATDATGDKRQALALFEQALAFDRETGDRAAEGYVLNYEALANDFLGDRALARRLLDAALTAVRDAHDQRAEGITLNNLGLISGNLGDRRTALDYFNQAIVLNRLVGNLRGQATTLTNIGGTYDALGDKPQALAYFNQALPLRQQIGDPRDLATTLNNIGVVYMSIDEVRSAAGYYAQAIDQWRRAGDVAGEAATLHNIAAVLERQGDYQGAIDQYTKALGLHRAMHSRAAEGNTLTNRGRLWAILGDHTRALEDYTQALVIHRAVGNRTSEAATLTSVGVEYVATGALDRALTTFAASLAIAQETSDRVSEATTLIDIGRVESRRAHSSDASAAFERAISLSRAVGSRRTEALAIADLAAARSSAGTADEAWPLYDQALAIERAIADRRAEAGTLFSLANAEEQAGRLATAHEHLTNAIALAESTRAAVATPDLRMTYFATIQDYFDLDLDVLVRLHDADPTRAWLDRAFEVSERARARGFLDSVAESRVDIREGVDRALLDRERDLTQSLSAKAERQTKLLSGAHTDAQARALAEEIRTLTVAYQDVQSQIRTTSPRYATLARPEPVGATEAVSGVVDADTTLVEFTLGTSRSYAIVVSRAGVDAVRLPSRAVIDAAVLEFYRATRTPAEPAVARAAAQTLGTLLLKPMAGRLRTPRLAIVASGSLQYVPFAAVTDPSTDRPLVLSHEIVSLPSATTLAALRSGGGTKPVSVRSLLVFADPVFSADDPRVTRRAGVQPPPSVTRSLTALVDDGRSTRLERLIGSRREAAAISAVFPPGAVTQVLDFDANRSAVTGLTVGRFRIVHFATHALVDSDHPALSGIVLSEVDRSGGAQNGFLGLSEVFNLRLNADLVVLSGCQTALGQDIRGEGLIGLSRAFMYAGARRVIASTWKVDDAATAELMTRFYRGLVGADHLTPAAALRAAQVGMMRQPRWQSPYYWAPFVLQGDWR